MTDIRTRLLDDDPLRGEPTLAPQMAQAMRRRVVTRHPTAARPAWTWTMTLAAALAVVVAAGVGLTRPGASTPENAPPAVVAQQHDDTGERRQLQFATPGGTRVIWVFNADFEMR